MQTIMKELEIVNMVERDPEVSADSPRTEKVMVPVVGVIVECIMGEQSRRGG